MDRESLGPDTLERIVGEMRAVRAPVYTDVYAARIEALIPRKVEALVEVHIPASIKCPTCGDDVGIAARTIVPRRWKDAK